MSPNFSIVKCGARTDNTSSDWTVRFWFSRTRIGNPLKANSGAVANSVFFVLVPENHNPMIYPKIIEWQRQIMKIILLWLHAGIFQMKDIEKLSILWFAIATGHHKIKQKFKNCSIEWLNGDCTSTVLLSLINLTVTNGPIKECHNLWPMHFCSNSNSDISNIDAICGALFTLTIQYEYTQTQCDEGASDGIDIWYMGIIIKTRFWELYLHLLYRITLTT